MEEKDNDEIKEVRIIRRLRKIKRTSRKKQNIKNLEEGKARREDDETEGRANDL